MEIKCPKCKKRYEVEDAAPGQEIQSVCPRCSTQFNYIVPAQAMAAIVPTTPTVPATTQVSQPEVSKTELIKTHPCPQCGCQVNDGASYCPGCGSYQFAGPDPKAQTQTVVQPQIVYVQQQQPQMNNGRHRLHDRSKVTAALLAFFLGGLGIHKFYLGQTSMGVLYLLFCWTWIPSIIAFVEFIIYLTMSDNDFDEKYNYS